MALKAAKEIVIKGKVHDVGYRLFLLSEAERLFIEKFDARNVLVDGEQHLVVLVEGAEDKISRFVEFAKSSYPPDASVQSVEVRAYGEEVRSIDSFRQSFMVFQLTKIAQAGVGMLGKQDTMLEKMDTMLEKQDETIKVIKEESEKTREVVKEEGEKTREVMREKLVEDVEWVKEEIIGIKATLSKVKEKVGVD